MNKLIIAILIVFSTTILLKSQCIPPISGSISTTSAFCGVCDGTAMILASGGAGALAYSWIPSGVTGDSAIMLCPGVHTVIVTDTSGCTQQFSAAVGNSGGPVVTPDLDVIDIKCTGDCFGIATATASGCVGNCFIEFLDSTGTQIASQTTGSLQVTNLCAGTYTSIVTDNISGCKTVNTYTVSEPTPIVLTASSINTSCVGANDGQVIASATGGTPPYIYQWYDSANNIISLNPVSSNQSPGNYYVVVTDQGLCLDTAYVIVNDYFFTGNTSITPSKCFLNCDGSITAFGVGGIPPYTFSFLDSVGDTLGSGGSVINNLCSGVYNITVTDSTGCSISLPSVVISSPTAIIPVTFSTDALCSGDCNGSVSAVVTGGIPPYNYQWADSLYSHITGATTDSLFDLCAGTYNIIVTDSIGCQSLWTPVAVNEPLPNLILTAVSTTVLPGSQAVVRFIVNGFQNIAGAQGSIVFDTSVISFIQAEQFGIGGMNASNFGNPVSGTVTFSWDDTTTFGVSLADGSILFSLRFNVTGTAGQQSMVDFTSSPVKLEFNDPQLNPVCSLFFSGIVDVKTSITVDGKIYSEVGRSEGIPYVSVNLNGPNPQSLISGIDGSYSFNITQGGNYSITPSKNNDLIINNGISTVDILIIRRHILNILSLGTPYKIIAADVNATGNVTTADILLIRSVILGNSTSFPNGKLWAFVPFSHQFINPLIPFPYPDSLSYPGISQLSNQDFIGMKLGDVNNSWDKNTLKSKEVGEVYLMMNNHSSEEGDEVVVPVRVKNFRNITGYQFTLSWDVDVLSFLGVTNMGVNGFYGVERINEGHLATSWNDEMAKAISLNDGDTIFELRFKVVGVEGSSSEINIDSRIVAKEAYNDNLDLLNIIPSMGIVKVEGVNQTFVDSYHLKAIPNPFSNSTNITFNIPNDQFVSIKIYNLLGEQIKQVNAYVKAGEHRIEWTGNDENGISLNSGIFHIRLLIEESSQSIRVYYQR